MADKRVNIHLSPQNLDIKVERGANLLKTLKDHQIPIGNACGGQGLCASCKVIVLKEDRGLSKPNDTELDLKDRNNLMDNERISCQCKILGDITITTTYW